MILITEANASEQLQEALDKISQQADELSDADVDSGIIREYINSLPEKALHLGVKVVIAFIIIVICQQFIKMLTRIIRRSMVRAKVEEGTIHFIELLVKVSLDVILAFGVLAAFGMDAASIVAILGSAGVAIGLALQGSLSNLAGGIVIMVVKPFHVGDYIIEESGGHEGTVVEIALFNTYLRTIDNRLIVIPNGNLAGSTIINSNGYQERILELYISISYDSDIRLAKTVLLHEMEACKLVLRDKQIDVNVNELGESAVILLTRCWVEPQNYRFAKWELNEHFKHALDEAGVHIPFPQMDVHLKQDESK